MVGIARLAGGGLLAHAGREAVELARGERSGERGHHLGRRACAEPIAQARLGLAGRGGSQLGEEQSLAELADEVGRAIVAPRAQRDERGIGQDAPPKVSREFGQSPLVEARAGREGGGPLAGGRVHVAAEEGVGVTGDREG